MKFVEYQIGLNIYYLNMLVNVDEMEIMYDYKILLVQVISEESGSFLKLCYSQTQNPRYLRYIFYRKNTQPKYSSGKSIQ